MRRDSKLSRALAEASLSRLPYTSWTLLYSIPRPPSEEADCECRDACDRSPGQAVLGQLHPGAGDAAERLGQGAALPAGPEQLPAAGGAGRARLPARLPAAQVHVRSLLGVLTCRGDCTGITPECGKNMSEPAEHLCCEYQYGRPQDMRRSNSDRASLLLRSMWVACLVW